VFVEGLRNAIVLQLLIVTEVWAI